MSLNVTAEQIELAQSGELTDEEFVEIIRHSLPFAYDTVERLAKSLADGEQFATWDPVHMDDGHRNQLLRVFASTAMRKALERHFGIAELAFQNCHYVAAVTEDGRTDDPRWRRFISKEGQVLAQRPELRDC